MIVFAMSLVLVSAAFFILWQYYADPWLLLVYILLLWAVFLWRYVRKRRKDDRILARLGRILTDGGASYAVEEELTPTERGWMARIAALETREREVQAAYANLSTLVSDIAHQTKTPLSTILLYTDMAAAASAPDTVPAPDAAAPSAMAVVRVQAQRLFFLMDALDKLAKCESGRIAASLTPQEGSVRALLRTVIEAYFAAAGEKGMTIRCRIPEELRAVFDPAWTAEAVGNLLDNAIKYGPAGSTITIAATAVDLFCRIDVSDEGETLPEEERTRIWKRFVRGKNAAGVRGVGIGLYLTEQIIRAQGGRVLVKPGKSTIQDDMANENPRVTLVDSASDPSASGNTFTIWLPVT